MRRLFAVPAVLACLALVGPPPAVAQGARIEIKKAEFLAVKFPAPVRIGHGDEARHYDRAVEIRLEVAPFAEGAVEPVLRVGDQVLRGHRTLRRDDAYVLAFDAFEPERLTAGGCLSLALDDAGGGTCAFRWDPAKVIAGTPLAEALLATGGRPPRPSGPAPLQQCGAGLQPAGPVDYKDFELQLFDPQDRPLAGALQAGDTLSVAVSNLPPLRQVQLRVIDDAGQEWAYARLSADHRGEVPRTVLWYNTGVIGTTSRKLGYRPDPAFETFREAYDYWRRHKATLEVLDDKGTVVGRRLLAIAADRREPLVYPSTQNGVLMNAMEVGRDPFHVTGTHFPAGSTVLVFVVENRYSWEAGNYFQDLTGKNLGSEVSVVKLAAQQTSFTIEPWRADRVRSGRYDIITRMIDTAPGTQIDAEVATFDPATDRVSFGADTAVALFEIIGGHIVMEIAGRELNLLPWYDSSWFEFSDVFERGQTVYGAVDPTDFPSWHAGGEYAAYFVVEAQPAAYWDAPNPPLVDISGPGMTSQPEIAQVKYGCINLTRTGIWPSANPPGCVSDYQVIVDFGSVPATSSGAYVFDWTYDLGTDFIDRYPGKGFTVVDDPAACCTYEIGRQDHYDDTLASGSNAAFDLSSLGFPLVRNWFTLRYPAQSPGGVGALLPPGTDRYPVVLFLHGRHATCATGSAFNPSCPPADRIPSHQGYDYMLDPLAQQGYIAISIDAYDIQPSNSSTNYEARGILILEHLNRLRDWDLNGTDPWGGQFQGRIDMSRIAIAGHSRGGEGVVAAVELDVANPGLYGHGIDAVIAIAPTNQQVGSPWEVLHTPYLLLIGAADGDVLNLQGFTPWDNAYPTGSSPQFEKSLAFVHGANHNFWNTVWTPSFGWAQSSDDGAAYTGPRLTEAEQRATGLAPVAGFVLQHLGGLAPYREIFTGHLPIASMPNDQMHWSYQHPGQKVLDDFENGNAALNTLGGAATVTGSLALTESSVGSCGYHPGTNGSAGLSWTTAGDLYETELPPGQRDVSAFTHLSFRVTQKHDSGVLNPVGQEKNVIVRLFDGNGDNRKVMTVDFREIPYPWQRNTSAAGYKCQMKGVRIPLRNFTMNNSGVDLTDIVKVQIEFPGTGKISIDDLQFTH